MAISMLDNIGYKGQKPDNARSSFATIEEMVNYSENYLPPIYVTLVEETGKQYKYQRSNTIDPVLGKWRDMEEGGNADLSNYYNKDEMADILEDYVEKEEGKGLSTNDYTDEEKKRITDLETAVDLLNDTDDKPGSVAEAAKNALESAKQFTRDEIDKVNKKGALTVDEKPTYSDGVVTYKKNGETLTTTNTNQWFYYNVGEVLYQTTFIDGEEKTIKSDVEVDFSEYVNKETDIVSTFTGTEVETDKVPDLAALKALVAIEDEKIGKRVSVEQGEDNADKILGTDETGNVVLLSKEALSQTAEGTTYKNDSHPTWNTVKKALDGIIAKVEYVKPEITSFTSNAQSVYEIGQKVSSITFNWTLNKEVTTQSLTDCEVDVADRTATYSTELSSNKTFSLNVGDGQNTAKKDISIAFRNKIYFGGAAEPGEYDSAFILGLAKNQFATSKAGSFAMTVGAGEYGYLAYPQSFGTLTTVNIGGFDVEVTKCKDIAFTNASGGVSTYTIYRTGRTGLGTITMVVK